MLMVCKSLISIITINFNNATGLKRTVESVISQSFSNFEYIVIDGGSSDGSLEIITQYSQKINFWTSEKDRGIYDAINKGIEQAKGDYLIFLNSGDYFTDNDVVALGCNFISQFPLTDIFYGDIFVSYTNPIVFKLHKHPAVVDLSFLKYKNLNHQSSIIKASLFKEYGLYPLDFKLASDHWLYLKCMVGDKKFKYIEHPMVTYDGEGLSHVNYSIYKEEADLLWKQIVPHYAQVLVDDLLLSKNILGYKLVKISLLLNAFAQRFKRNK